jgi:ABC-type lipoprotein release transport system permease subunit
MNFKAYRIILTRQIKQKFGRFLLASGGIAVGVWAITLTNGISTGFQNTVVTAINSQPSAKEAQVFSTKEQKVSLFGSSSPTFVPKPISKWKQLKNDYPDIQTVITNDQISVNLTVPGTEATCATPQLVPQTLGIRQTQQQQIIKKSNTDKECINTSVTRSNLLNFYENNKPNWLGEIPNNFGDKDIAICYSCGKDVHNLWKTNDPKDLLGKAVKITPTQAPRLYALGQDIKFDRNAVDSFVTSESILQSEYSEEYIIRAVVDDSKTSAVDFTGSVSYLYLPDTVFTTAFEKANPGSSVDEFGLIGARVVTTKYDKLEGLVLQLNKQYLAISTGLFLVQGIIAGFGILNAVLFGFGIIAIIASIFGIVNVMAISVLERKKEIGILKALGAKNNSIFGLFLSESAVLGFLGWGIGTSLAVAMGYGISSIFNYFAANNADFKTNLATFNITSFSPQFGLGLLGFTLLLALVFTIASGLFPSLRAARQNPAEVMRAE